MAIKAMKTITGGAMNHHATIFSKTRIIAKAQIAKTTRRQNQILRLRCCSLLSEARRAARRFAYSSRGSIKAKILSFKVSIACVGQFAQSSHYLFLDLST